MFPEYWIVLPADSSFLRIEKFYTPEEARNRAEWAAQSRAEGDMMVILHAEATVVFTENELLYAVAETKEEE